MVKEYCIQLICPEIYLCPFEFHFHSQLFQLVAFHFPPTDDYESGSFFLDHIIGVIYDLAFRERPVIELHVERPGALDDERLQRLILDTFPQDGVADFFDQI